MLRTVVVVVDDVEVELVLVDDVELVLVVGVHPPWAKRACKAAMRAGSVATAILLAMSWHCAGDSVVDVVDGAMVVDVLVEDVLDGVVVLVVVVAELVGGVQAALYWTWSAALVAGSVVLLMRAWMASQTRALGARRREPGEPRHPRDAGADECAAPAEIAEPPRNRVHANSLRHRRDRARLLPRSMPRLGPGTLGPTAPIPGTRRARRRSLLGWYHPWLADRTGREWRDTFP